MDHKYWMDEYIERNKTYNGEERRHSLLEHFPIVSFYLVSLLVVLALISA